MVGVSLFMSGKDLITPFYPPRGYCEARGGLFKCQEKIGKAVFTTVEVILG